MSHMIILKNGEGQEQRFPIAGNLGSAKISAEARFRPGLRVRIVTSRGSTWTYCPHGERPGWRHDTGRRG